MVVICLRLDEVKLVTHETPLLIQIILIQTSQKLRFWCPRPTVLLTKRTKNGSSSREENLKIRLSFITVKKIKCRNESSACFRSRPPSAPFPSRHYFAEIPPPRRHLRLRRRLARRRKHAFTERTRCVFSGGRRVEDGGKSGGRGRLGRGP